MTDDLLAALVRERYDNRWWTSKRLSDEAVAMDDNDVVIARRRRQLAADFERVNETVEELA